MEVLLQKSSLTLTAIALVPVLAMAFGLTVPGIVSDVATVTKGAGPWRSVNFERSRAMWTHIACDDERIA